MRESIALPGFLVARLDEPWFMAFLPDGALWVLEDERNDSQEHRVLVFDTFTVPGKHSAAIRL